MPDTISGVIHAQIRPSRERMTGHHLAVAFGVRDSRESPVGQYSAVMTGRGLQGRRVARQMIRVAFACGVALLVGWIALPGYVHPMFGSVPWYVDWLPVVGVAIYFLGLGWMVRIYRANPEPDAHNWRYRDF